MHDQEHQLNLLQNRAQIGLWTVGVAKLLRNHVGTENWDISYFDLKKRNSEKLNNLTQI